MVQAEDADGVVTFDLGDLFDDNVTQIEQFNEEGINDTDLIHFVSNLITEQSKNVAFHNEMEDTEADDTCDGDQNNQFNEVDDEYLDELASEIHKKCTKKQTNWAVKVSK